MKIGKFKKIAAIGLALTMAIGLLYTSGTVNATDDSLNKENATEQKQPTIDELNISAQNYTNAGPLIKKSTLKSKSRMLNQSNENDDGVFLNKKAVYNDKTGEIDITLESYATGSITTTGKPLDIVLVLDQSGSMNYSFDSKNTRNQAMKTAVNNFIDMVYNNVKDVQNVTHNVGIIKYSSNASTLVSLRDIKGNIYGQSNLDFMKRRVNNMDADGATDIASGMKSAENMLKSSTNQKVVILFTDGVPTTSSAFSIGVADSALATAYKLKNKMSATVYAVGIMPGADKSFVGNVDDYFGEYKNDWFYGPYWDGGYTDSKRANRFMNYLSSNSSNATSMGVEEETNIYGHGTDKYYVKTNYNCDNQQNPGYYLTANNSTALNEIFKNIFDQTIVPSVDLSKSTIVKDTMSDYLILPEDMNKNDVKVYIAAHKGNHQFETNEQNWEEVENAIINIDKDNKSISVSNFDYSQHIVVNENKDNQPDGDKLIIKFSVDVKPGFIGGNNVPTNDYENSGISDPKISTLDKKFNEEDANIDINYTTDTFDQSIYIGNQYNSFEDFITNDSEEITYMFNGEEYHLGDEATNQYVNIVYTVKASDNTTVIGTYTVNAGDSTGTWKLVKGFDTTKLTSTTKFNIDVKVTPSITGVQVHDKRPAQEADVSEFLKSALYIFAPELNSHDGNLFLGNTENNLNQYVTVNVDGWYCTDTEAENVPQPKGAKPKLDIIVNGTDINNNSFTPKKEGKYTFTYTVKNNGVPITVAKYNHNSSDTEHSNCHKNDFIINVTGGTIELSKIIDEMENYPLQEDPIFIFKIDQKGNNGVNKTYYRIVRMSYNEDGIFDSSIIPDITGLPAGEYTVTELPSMRFGFVSATLNDEPKNTRSFEFRITENNRIVNISYKNELKFDDSFSDNDVVVNSFSKNSDGSISINQDWLNSKKEGE